MPAAHTSRRRARPSVSRRDLALGLAAGILGGLYAQEQKNHRFVADALQQLPKRNDWGRPLPAVDATSTLGQPVEQCRIAKWGERPFRRPDEPMDARWEADAYACMRAQGIAPVHAFALVERIRLGTPDEEVRISNNVVRGQIQDYSPYMATSYRGSDGLRRVCHAARANHRSAEYQEPAAAYHSGGYVVAVPYACNNPTRLFPRPAAGAQSAHLAYPLLPGEPPALRAPGAAQPGAALAQAAAEPASLGLAGLALVALFFARRRIDRSKETS